MDNKGISFVETLLTLVIILTLTGSLIPLSFKQQQSLFLKEIDLHSSQVAYNAAKQIVYAGSNSGTETIDNTIYHWSFDGRKLCVSYELFEKDENKCFTEEGVL
ncbi:MAG TPA: hypothetical protein VNR38_03970 [Ureibacillus sp.]|nr:hypothetical protein [Ureibacillus sp.]